MKFTENELQKELKELTGKGWLNNFKENEFINRICSLEFTSPKKEDVFKAFKLFEPEKTRILIIGQDPYPDEKYPDKADGLAFSQNGQKPAVDSLKNIFEAIKKYKNKMGIEEEYPICEWDTNLKKWAKTENQEVLLLNTALTYKAGENHCNYWQPFIEQIVLNLITKAKNNELVIFLWGVPSQQLLYKCAKHNEEYLCKLKKKLKECEFTKLKNGKLVNRKDAIYFYKSQIFMTSHPCNRSKWLGFEKAAPEHFELCDKFLDKGIWLDFK